MKWTAIRVSAETVEMLEKIRQSMIENMHAMKDAEGDIKLQSGKPDTRDRIGMDQVVRRLLRHYLAHARRRAKHISKRKGG